MAKTKLGTLPIDILARIGDEEPICVGTVAVPLFAQSGHPTGMFTVDLREPVETVRAMFRGVFEQAGADPDDVAEEVDQ